MNRGEIIGTERHMRGIALSVGGVALLVACSFLARTEFVLGGVVKARLMQVAKSRKIDLEVGTIRPSGLWGISLVHVAARVPRPGTGRQLEAWMPRVDIEPSLSALLGGELVIEEVVLRDATLAVTPFRGFRASPKGVPSAAVAKPAVPAPSPRKEATSNGAFANGLRVEAENLVVHYRADVSSSGAVRMRRVSADFDPELRAVAISGYGLFPDDVKFALRSEPREGGGLRVAVNSEKPTWLDAWIDAHVPVKVGLTGLVYCHRCEEATSVEVKNLFLGTSRREEAVLRSPSATLRRDGSEVVITAAEMEFASPSSANLFTARIIESEIVLDLDRAYLRGGLDLADTAGGTLTLDWEWEGDLSVDLISKGFETGTVWEALGLYERVRPGRMDGTTALRWTREQALLDITSDLSFRDFEASIRRVSSEPLLFPRFALRTHALLDIPGRALSISSGELTLGGQQRLRFGGRLLDAGDGVVFDGKASASSVDAAVFRDELPATVARVARGAEIQGEFGFELKVHGHSAYPKDLQLDGEIQGDVQVIRDSPEFDVRSLTAAGPPPQLKRASLKTWQSYAELPPTIALVLLSAEDAAFFEHPGFDWPGLQRAMAHNLETRALARGGSTISQQVVKNVFLAKDRTLVRKLQEAYLTWRMEDEVSKERILEIYLNIVDWGGGAVGIQRAAQHYFGVDAVELSVPEMALLAAILPGPTRYGRPVGNGKLPSSRMHKIQRILKNMRFLGHITMAEYNAWVDAAQRGQIGRATFEICDDADGLRPCF